MFNKQDARHFISTLSIKKITNFLKIYLSYLVTKYTKKSILVGLPFNVSIEPTTGCNLGCTECPSGLKIFSRPTGNLDEKTFRTAVDQLEDVLIYLYLYFQGEPYLHPRFFDFVRYAAVRKIYTVTSTNGHYLTPRKAEETVTSGLSRIIISLDGATQESYEKYRVGGSLEKVLEGARNLVAAKKKLNSAKPHIIFQTVVMKTNEQELAEIKKIAEEIGVDEIKFKSAQIYNYENGNELIPENESMARYSFTNGQWVIKNKLLNHCWKLWHSCVITWDGAVVPCCFDKDAKYKQGNINEVKFEEIWKNGSYASFRAKVLHARKNIDICSNCSEGTKVWVG
jgi:radical SAM protein with 4Fe4S-binding SPASM domain